MRVTRDERTAGPTSLAGPMRRLRVPVLIQFVKFGVVGVSNTLLTLAVYTLLVKVFDVWYLAASGIGFVAGAVNGFLLNRRWTFRGHVGDALTPVRWTVVQGCGLGCNLGLVYLFVGGADLDELVGQALATAIVTVLTFAANRSWTFRVHPEVAYAGDRVGAGPVDGHRAFSGTRPAGRVPPGSVPRGR
jgi:putative flippase GtrA